jgi:predicted DCC family thiol-disulfide oxidoreductase YuxK
MRFLFKLDKKQVIKCCTLQNEYYKDVALKGAQSVILIWKGQYFFESDAIIQALKLIGYVGVFMSAIIALFPARVRNWMYKFVAKRRYRLFGKSETCMIPEALWKNRLIQ